MANKYRNFVRPESPREATVTSTPTIPFLDGRIAKKLYLDEVKDVTEFTPAASDDEGHSMNDGLYQKPKSGLKPDRQVSDKDLFISVQKDDVETLKMVLNVNPDKIMLLDDYGWSLLMIACQANAVESAKELLQQNIDTSIRDKAGNSAQSLVIKNKNLALVDLLLAHKARISKSVPKANSHEVTKSNISHKHKKLKAKGEFICDICNNKYSNRSDHLSSTIHNLNASKGKKIPPNFKIPQNNRGYQLMVKVGWDRESGLGPEGSGLKYPIKTVQKKDRKGLGLEKKKDKTEAVPEKQTNRKTLARNDYKNRRMEADFRRQFY